jgi:hypothetical protein
MTLRVAAFIAAMLAGAAVARAQEQAPASVQEFDPIAPGWTFTPTVALGWFYDSNVALIDPGFERPRQSDQVFLIVPGGELAYLGKYTRVTGGYRGAILRYRTLDELHGYDQRVWGSLNHRLSPRVTLVANQMFHHSPTTDDLLLNGVVFRRTGARTNMLGGGAEVQLSRLTSLKAKYEMVSVAFDREEVTGLLLGGRSHGIETELKHRLTSRLSLGGVYDVRVARLDTAADGSPLVDPESLSFHNAGGSVGFELTPSTTLSAAAGIAVLDYSRRAEPRVGPFLRMGITHRARRTIASAEYFRAAVPTFGFAASSMSEQIRGSVHMPVYRNRLYVQTFGAWRRTDPLADLLRLNTIYFRSALGVGLSEAVRIEGFYFFSRQDSRVPGGLVLRHRVGAQLVLGHPLRIR